MTSWLKRTQAGIHSVPTTAIPGSALVPTTTNAGHFRDPNAPDIRLDVESRCIYERRLPGNAYITAHVTRLQDGFYDSPSTHGDTIDNVRFVAVHFVFHPSETVNRFQGAIVTIALHDDTNQLYSDPPIDPRHRLSAFGPREPRNKPKFLRFAPHVLFGGVSPETLDWNFNLTGSLGIAQSGANASISPSGGVKSSYKLYQMMRIQGSTRTVRDRQFNGSGYDIEDGEVVWTMEENPLQQSGLPREMTFVMLITKGDVENVVFDINVEPKIASWFGHFPHWWCKQLKYQPLQKEHTDLDRQLGQVFSPEIPGKGFNFANLAGTFNDFVSMPGTTYSLTDQAFRNQIAVPDETTHQASVEVLKAPKPAAPSRHNTAPAQAQPNPPIRPQSVLPQQSAQQSSTSQDEPMDYHIYLHNPRSINLHATPPPQSSSAPPQLPKIANPLYAAYPIPRSQTTVPERTKSPMNTKMKRRSIDIGNLGAVKRLSPTQSHMAIRNISSGSGGSHGSLRRSRSRTDLRSSPLVEDSQSGSHSSDRSQISQRTPHHTHSRSNKENLSPPTSSPDGEVLIPMLAPSPPGASSKMFSPTLPSNPQPIIAVAKGGRLPFELRRNHSDRDRPERKPRARDSPSPMRKRREITPSPSATNENSPEAEQNIKSVTDEAIDMRTGTTSPPITNARTPPIASLGGDYGEKLTSPANDTPSGKKNTRRERAALRDISPYAYANGTLFEEDWDERQGDLRKLRQRKRMSLPVASDAHFSYITPTTPELNASADVDWGAK